MRRLIKFLNWFKDTQSDRRYRRRLGTAPVKPIKYKLYRLIKKLNSKKNHQA